MRILLAAGGSAGHINPALAIADKVLETFPDSDILFMGTDTGLESKLVPKAGYDFKAIKAAGLQRKLNIKNLGRNAKALYYFITAKQKAKDIISLFNPDIVIGTGGYVTAPILKTAAKMGIKTATHESNSLPGMTTKMLSKTVDRVFVSSRDTLKHLPRPSDPSVYKITGNPLRSGFKREDRAKAKKMLGLKGSMTILSFGGSLGANKISEAVMHLLKWEGDKGDINHIHAYGGNGRTVFEGMLSDKGITPDRNRHIFSEYIHNMYTCIAAADLVICRSGSMTQTELKAFGRASIQIPWAGAAENHQYYNALTMEKAGATILIKDDEINGEVLVKTVSALYNDRIRIRTMEENAAKMAKADSSGIIVSEIIDMIR